MPNPDPGMIDGILFSYTSVLRLGWTGLTPNALWLLSQVATWYLIATLILSLTPLQEKLFDMLWALTVFMVYAFLITNLHFLTSEFANLLVRVGLMMGGNSMTAEQFMQPSQVILQGWNTTLPLYVFLADMSSSWWSALTNFFAILIYDLGVLMPMWLCFNLMAWHIVFVVVLFQMTALFGLIFIPFGIFSGTAFIAEGAINGILSNAVRLGTLAFITGVQIPWINRIAIQPQDGTPGLWSALSAASVAGLLAVISWQAPKFTAAYFGGAAAVTGTTVIAAVAGVVTAGRRLGR